MHAVVQTPPAAIVQGVRAYQSDHEGVQVAPNYLPLSQRPGHDNRLATWQTQRPGDGGGSDTGEQSRLPVAASDADGGVANAGRESAAQEPALPRHQDEAIAHAGALRDCKGRHKIAQSFTIQSHISHRVPLDYKGLEGT